MVRYLYFIRGKAEQVKKVENIYTIISIYLLRLHMVASSSHSALYGSHIVGECRPAGRQAYQERSSLRGLTHTFGVFRSTFA
jgi:hypothetical protein